MERTCEEQAAAYATKIAGHVTRDSIALYALRVAAEPDHSETRNNAYSMLHTDVRQSLGGLLTGGAGDLELIGQISCALQRTAGEPDATIESVRRDGAVEIAKVLLPLLLKEEQRRQETEALCSFDWNGRYGAF